jgi:hypothetical protein
MLKTCQYFTDDLLKIACPKDVACIGLVLACYMGIPELIKTAGLFFMLYMMVIMGLVSYLTNAI